MDHSDADTVVRLKAALTWIPRRTFGIACGPSCRAIRPPVVTVDLSDVTSIEASGIATLIEALKVARHREIDSICRGVVLCSSCSSLLGCSHCSTKVRAEMVAVLMANILENVGERTIEHPTMSEV